MSQREPHPFFAEFQDLCRAYNPAANDPNPTPTPTHIVLEDWMAQAATRALDLADERGVNASTLVGDAIRLEALRRLAVSKGMQVLMLDARNSSQRVELPAPAIRAVEQWDLDPSTCAKVNLGAYAVGAQRWLAERYRITAEHAVYDGSRLIRAADRQPRLSIYALGGESFQYDASGKIKLSGPWIGAYLGRGLFSGTSM